MLQAFFFCSNISNDYIFLKSHNWQTMPFILCGIYHSCCSGDKKLISSLSWVLLNLVLWSLHLCHKYNWTHKYNEPHSLPPRPPLRHHPEAMPSMAQSDFSCIVTFFSFAVLLIKMRYHTRCIWRTLKKTLGKSEYKNAEIWLYGIKCNSCKGF